MISDKKARAAAINVVKAWVPHIQPMYSMIREFALQMLRKLQYKPTNGHTKLREKQDEDITMGDASPPKENGVHTEDQDSVKDEPPIVPTDQVAEGDREETMEDGQTPEEDLVQTPYLPERIELPAQKSQVLQHVELLFALSVKLPEFLEA